MMANVKSLILHELRSHSKMAPDTLHKLLEEILTGETLEAQDALRARATELLVQIGVADNADPADGPCSVEIAASTLRGLELPEIVALRPRLQSEVPVYDSKVDGMTMELTSGVADAVAIAGDGKIEAVIDWKSDVDPDPALVELYRGQVRDYLAATKAPKGLIVFLTLGRVEKVAPNP